MCSAGGALSLLHSTRSLSIQMGTFPKGAEKLVGPLPSGDVAEKEGAWEPSQRSEDRLGAEGCPFLHSDRWEPPMLRTRWVHQLLGDLSKRHRRGARGHRVYCVPSRRLGVPEAGVHAPATPGASLLQCRRRLPPVSSRGHPSGRAHVLISAHKDPVVWDEDPP